MSEKPAPPRCLIVDDDKTWLRLISVVVDHPQVVYVTSASEALTALANNNVAILITDTNMPVTTGIDLLKTLRADPHYQELPIIVLFNGLAGSSMTREDVLDLGATLVMTKEEFLSGYPHLLRRWLGS